MIQKINKIKDFGVFQSFAWKADLPVFNRYNLLYGWNYSGKTTFSRIFRCFEQQKLHEGYVSGCFKIEMENGDMYDESLLNKIPIIRVFNSDFIKENLRWEEQIEPILMLGKENIQLQKELEKQEKELDEKRTDLFEREKNNKEKRASLKSKASSQAIFIKNNLRIPVFYVTHFMPYVEEVKDHVSELHLEEKELPTLLESYNSSDKLPEVSFNIPDLPKLSYFSAKVQSIIQTKLGGSFIEKLQKNRKLEQWVKEGIPLHKEKETCEFCGGTLSEDLLDTLNEHFSEDHKELESQIRKAKQEIEHAKISIKFPDKTRFYKHLRPSYKRLKTELEQLVEFFNKALDALLIVLQKKEGDIYSTFEVDQATIDDARFNKIKHDLAKIIKEHNKRTQEFEKELNDAKEKLIKHYAADFLKEQNYFQEIALIEDEDEQIDKENEKLNKIEQEILNMKETLSETVKGAERVNQYLISFFGKEDIQIKVTDDEKFQLYRGDNLAKNLSEGEKTAIAFAYFITRLEDKETQIKDSIIFIDDPVSSLDANHLFNTVSVIKIKLRKAKQLFISTHNSKFFNLIKDWFNSEFKRLDRNKKHSELTKWRAFLIEREKEGNSIIREIPEELIRFKSEYHFLFSILYEFHDSPSTDYRHLYNLPNIMRRFLEAFAGFKLPRYSGLRNKMKDLIPDKIERDKVWKFINHYSHNRSLSRSLNFPDMQECTEVVKIVMEMLERKDKPHLESLAEFVNS